MLALTRDRPRSFALLACVLVLPALGSGLMLDDYFLASKLRDAHGVRWTGLLDAFSFAYDVQNERELGELPWWSDDQLRLRFLRPLSALTHLVDLWLPTWLAHVESVLLLALVNLAATRWYTRLLGPGALGWALCLFTLAPGHVFVAAWLANRNALLATLFAIWSANWHERARREGGRWGWLSLACLCASLLSGELGVSTLALLLPRALFLDSAPGRWRSLAPHLAVTATWVSVHHALGYGVHASSLYVDPLGEPLAYARALARHLPMLAFSQWGLPMSSFALMMSREAALAFLLLALACLAAWVPSWRALWRDDARARFCSVAMLLALLPVAASVPHERLTPLADLPAFALLGLAMEGAGVWLRRWIASRVVLTSLLAFASAAALEAQAAPGAAPFADVARDGTRPVVFLNPPCAFYTLYLRRMRMVRRLPVPPRVRALAPGATDLELERVDAYTLRMRVMERALPWLSEAWLLRNLDAFARREPLRAGDRITLSDVQIEVRTRSGDRLSLDFRFTQPLEEMDVLQWVDGRWIPFQLPAVGFVR